MAKGVAYSKLGLKRVDEVKEIKIGEQTIEVKQYLPMEDKIQLVTDVLINSLDDNNFINPMKIEVFTSLEIIFYYTNITFTEKQKEDAPKLYDVLESNGIIGKVIAEIPEVEYQAIYDFVNETAHNYYTFKNSALGIMEAIGSDYSNLNLDAEALREKMTDENVLPVLKDVMTKLG